MVQRLRRQKGSVKGMNMMKIIRKIAAVVFCAAIAASLAACGGSGSMDDYLQEHEIVLENPSDDQPTVPNQPVSGADVSGSDVSGSDVSASDVTTTTTTTTTATTTIAAPVANVLPEYFIGTWAVINVYQEAPASDISLDEALRREQMTGISFGSSYFDRSGESVSGAVFTVNEKATYADMERFGISTKPLIGPYGSDAKIVSVEVSTSDGMTCTTVFLINDMTLIAFGSGMNVFTYELMNAVG